MTERLQDLFEEMLMNEPPLRLSTGDVLHRGRRMRLRRRWVSTAAAVLAAGLVAGVGIAYATSGSSTPTPTASAIKDTAYPVPSGAVYVSTSGRDDAAGTAEAPLRTLTAAVAKASAGGTVVLRAGTYREGGIKINKRITIQPAAHEQVWIKGSDVVNAWTRDGSAWRATTWTTPFCQDCHPAGAVDSAHPLAGRPDQVFVGGDQLRQVGTRDAVAAGTFFVDPSSKALVIGDNPTSTTVEVSARWLALQTNAGAAGSVIRGLGFSEYAPHWNEDQLAAVVVASADSIVENNTFTRSAARSLGVFAARATVVGNIVVDNGGPGANMNRADGTIVRNNTFDRNNTEHFSVANCGAYCTMAGLKVAHTKGIVVESNSFAGNDGAGFWCDLGCTDGKVTGNIVAGNTTNGLYWEVSSLATISGNSVTGNGRGVKISGSDRVTVTGNTFTDNGLQLGIYDDARSPSTDGYSTEQGLSWNTSQTVVTENVFTGGGNTQLLVETNRTSQVDAPGMLATARDNTVSGVEPIQWCPASCTRYPTVAAFAAGTGIPFGKVTQVPSPSSPAAGGPSTPAGSASAPAAQPSTSPSGPGSANILADPGFEAPTMGWVVFGPSTTLARSTTARTGGSALKVTSSATGTVVAGATDHPVRATTVAGRRYTATCWARSSRTVSVRVQLQEYTQGWKRVTDPTASDKVVLSDPGRWYQVTVGYTPTNTGNLLPLTVFSTSLAPGGAELLVDDCSLTVT